MLIVLIAVLDKPVYLKYIIQELLNGDKMKLIKINKKGALRKGIKWDSSTELQCPASIHCLLCSFIQPCTVMMYHTKVIKREIV